MKGRQLNKLKIKQHFAINIWDFESAKVVIDAAVSLN